MAFKAAGGDVARHCIGCHSPAGMVTGEIKGPGLAGLGRMALAGVSCDICHSVSGVTHWQTPSREPENGSLILSPGEDRADGFRLIKYGPYKPAEGCGGGFHDCAESPLLVRADLCASCHQLSHYETHFPIESTYYEWMHSPYGQKGIFCQDCHMVDIDTFIRIADTMQKPDPMPYRHYFGGANYLLFSLAEAAARKAGDNKLAANLKKKFDMAVARLKAAADLEIIPVYRDGAFSGVTVRVRNIRAGHNLPTSLTNVRQMWLEVTIKDAGGKVLLASGRVDRSGALVPGTRLFNSEGMGASFHFALDPWAVTAFAKKSTIPPRGYMDVDFSVTPVRKRGPVTVDARLRYRQADQQVAARMIDAVTADINIEKIYGIKKLPALMVVDMVKKKESFSSKQ
jgi:hypothetical protein